jgi:hypothetical protein
MDETPKNPSESDLKKVENFLKGLNDKKAPKVRRKPKSLSVKEKQKLGTAIASTLSEFVDCYILLGFDVNGNSMILINSNNNLESRALSDLVEDFMTTGGSNINMGFESDEDEDDQQSD